MGIKAIMEVQIKTTSILHFLPVRMAKINKKNDYHACRVRANTPPLLVRMQSCTVMKKISVGVSQEDRN